MFGACVINFGGHWDMFLPLFVFSYNNGNHSSIVMESLEALYRRGYRSPVVLFETGNVKTIWVYQVKDDQDKVRSIQSKLLEAQSIPKKYAIIW